MSDFQPREIAGHWQRLADHAELSRRQCRWQVYINILWTAFCLALVGYNLRRLDQGWLTRISLGASLFALAAFVVAWLWQRRAAEWWRERRDARLDMAKRFQALSE